VLIISGLNIQIGYGLRIFFRERTKKSNETMNQEKAFSRKERQERKGESTSNHALAFTLLV
jgi:hypothetical protein